MTVSVDVGAFQLKETAVLLITRAVIPSGAVSAATEVGFDDETEDEEKPSPRAIRKVVAAPAVSLDTSGNTVLLSDEATLKRRKKK